MHVCVRVCVCVCVDKPVAVELRCHATALINAAILPVQCAMEVWGQISHLSKGFQTALLKNCPSKWSSCLINMSVCPYLVGC